MAPDNLVPIIVPDLGSGGDSVSISNWYVEPGDAVFSGDPIVELLVPGITCDIAAVVSGRVARIEKEVGETVRPGEALAWIIPEASQRTPREA